MLYFIYGDMTKAVAKARLTVDALLSRQPNAARFKLDSDHWSDAEFQEFVGGQGLFSERYIVELRRVFDRDDVSSMVLGALKELAESPNVFIWVEASVTAADLKKIEKHAAKVQECKGASEKQKVEYNLFPLADALGERDKKRLWVGYIDALSNAAVEEIHGVLFWQVKSMLLAVRAKDADDAGMKTFPFGKAKRFAKNYTETELLHLSRALIEVSHEARRGTHDFSIALERLLLAI
ncbi:MAG: hypothetical protein RL150_567 [Candidatus Parcubacteria bacterium]|jgi:hypothetical protein